MLIDGQIARCPLKRITTSINQIQNHVGGYQKSYQIAYPSVNDLPLAFSEDATVTVV